MIKRALRTVLHLLVTVVILTGTRALATPVMTQILGQPTDHSITVNVRTDTALEMYFEYGVTSGVYAARTPSVVATADPYASGFFVAQSVMDGLLADSGYYYRMQYRVAGSATAFTAGAENSFHTQRAPGSSFIFCVQGDSHPERPNSMFNSDLYIQTLTAVASEKPDFYITSGDDFSVDTLPTPYTSAAVTGRYTLQLPYFDIVARSSPVFLGTGNHEETSLSNYTLPPDAANSNQVPVWAQSARNLYYAVPGPNDAITGSFYTGNTTTVPGIGMLRDYYAWTWGDALFVVIDPYWSSPAQVDTGLGGQAGAGGKTTDKWSITHGDAQYQWLKQTLEQSHAKWKFVFAHHVMGTGRGGIEIANQYEWGGNNGNGTPGFLSNRPTWPLPIHQLMAANHVTVFFQAHDHLFVHQLLDGVTYQELPNPADNTYTAFNSDAYTTGDKFPNAGYVKVTVGPSAVKVEYVREFLPKDENPPTSVSGTVQFAYSILSTTPASGWWWDPQLNGTGFFIEDGGKSGNGMFVGGFLYDSAGNNIWLVSTGQMSGSTYTNTWLKTSGGQTLTGPYKAPTNQPAGTLSIAFSDSTHALMTRPDGTQINLQRFSFTASATPVNPVQGTPQTGWWWAGSALSGTGYGVEIQGNAVFIVAYVYDDAGNPVWYLATGNLATPTSYTGTWDVYAGGPQLTSPEGTYSASKVAGKSVPMSLTFSDATHGTLTMGSVTVPIVRFQEF